MVFILALDHPFSDKIVLKIFIGKSNFLDKSTTLTPSSYNLRSCFPLTSFYDGSKLFFVEEERFVMKVIGQG